MTQSNLNDQNATSNRPIYTAVYNTFLYLIFYFIITFSIDKKKYSYLIWNPKGVGQTELFLGKLI
jgi:hypothetical protein